MYVAEGGNLLHMKLNLLTIDRRSLFAGCHESVTASFVESRVHRQTKARFGLLTNTVDGTFSGVSQEKRLTDWRSSDIT
jgi:hypothetical protein